MTELKMAATAVLFVTVLAGAPALAEDADPPIEIGMHVDVAADGTVTAVVPEEGLLPALHDSLIRHAMQWQFAPATWQGKPVAVRQWESVKIEPVRTSGGGYAIRILGTGHKHDPESEAPPPSFPHDALRAGVNAALVYRVHVAEDGSMSPVELLEPDAAHGYLRSLDKVSRAAIATYHRSPVTADGIAIACDLRLPLTFSTTKKLALPDTDAAPPLDNQCPGAKLETKIAGTML